MTTCSPTPGMCGRSADCADEHCHGRLQAIFEQRCGGALIEDGHAVYEDRPEPSDLALPLPARVCIGLTALACVAAVFWPYLS